MNDLSPVSRPVLRWHGGKWLLAPWIISNMPNHRTYVEPFGGAGSVLMRKPRAYAEVWNDLDHDAVNLFQVLRSDRAVELQKAIELTPFAREEFEISYKPTTDAVEKARRLVIRSFMGFGSDGCNDARPTGFRANSNRSGSTPAHDWTNIHDNLKTVVDRLRGVIIENKDAKAVMSQHDSAETLHYVDPPYVWSTRAKAKNSERKNYRHELSDDDHVALLDFLRKLQGMVMVSGYRSALYDAALKDWKHIERDALADGARKRTEVLWLNSAAVAATRKERLL
jgi:DNA adenine methylase